MTANKMDMLLVCIIYLRLIMDIINNASLRVDIQLPHPNIQSLKTEFYFVQKWLLDIKFFNFN